MISTDPPTASTTLTVLLDRAQQFAPEYRGGLSNHLPMALVALDSLGADASRMEAFFTIDCAKLDPAPPLAAACKDWPTKRGDLGAFPALRAHFVGAIATQGRDATLRQALSLVMDGVGAGAFHGLLRTASAAVAEHDDELASGLAYWAGVHLPLAHFAAAPSATEANVPTWLAGIAAQAGDWRSDAGLITRRMTAFAQTARIASKCMTARCANSPRRLWRFTCARRISPCCI